MDNIKRVEDVKKTFQINNYKVFGIGGLPLTRSEAYPIMQDFELICSNKTGEWESVEQKIKINKFSIKNNPGSKKPEEILSDQTVIDYIRKNSRKKKVGIYIMKPNKAIEDVCKKNNWTAISSPLDLYKKYSNRVNFYDLLKKAGITKDYLYINYQDLSSKKEEVFLLGERVVVQVLEEEGGGKGTFFFEKTQKDSMQVEIKKRLSDIKREDKLIVSKFVDGPVMSFTACVTRDNGILTLKPQLQLIDIKESVEKKSNAQGIFCGHDWSLSNDLPEDLIKETDNMGNKIGNLLKKDGYKGIFGVDFIWDRKSSKIIPLEINARILGAYPAQVQVQLEASEVPLLAFHFLEHLGIDYRINSKNVFRNDFDYEGSHLILFNFLGNDIIFNENLPGGVYEIDENGRLLFLRYGFELSDIKDENREFILTDGAPVKGRTVKKDKKILRIIAKRSLAKGDGKELNNWGLTITSSIKDKIRECSTLLKADL
ncbi:MAG: ATP-grasp domain-containing protein [Candidatus Moranbacteria bacterium]|nr:ATP-grasp domain-containing protein [Candidatus Moranbacteria bacterium]